MSSCVQLSWNFGRTTQVFINGNAENYYQPNYKVFQLNYEILKATSVFDYYVFHAKGSWSEDFREHMKAVSTDW